MTTGIVAGETAGVESAPTRKEVSKRTLRSKKLRAALYHAQDGKCALCGCELSEDWEADHVVPWSIVPDTNVHAMQALCRHCNRKKGASMLRKHQKAMEQLCEDIVDGKTERRKILAYVTPGGGKSALPAIIAKHIAEPLDYRICWVVPRDALRKQGESSFIEPEMRELVGHSTEIRAAGNDFNPARSTIGYVTTYQAIAQNPQLHLDYFELLRQRKHPLILFLDEGHHVPAPNEDIEDPEEKAYYKAIAPLVDLAEILVIATGTLERHDNKKIAFLPYTGLAGGEWVDLDSSEWAVIRYTRKDGLEEGAIRPLHMAYGDGAAIWTSPTGQEISIESIAEMEQRHQSAALRTVLETNYAYTLLDKCIEHWTQYKQNTYADAKMLVIAPSQRLAREYTRYLSDVGLRCESALSDDGDDAKIAIDRFKNKARPHIDVLVSVAIAYEGLDVKQISHVALLTKYRSKPWIEQAISRANRSATGKTHGYIYAPDDPSLRKILDGIEKEQQGVVIPTTKREIVEGVGGATRLEISPVGSELTRSRGYGLDDGTETTWEEDSALEAAMKQYGITASTVQLKQLLTSLGMSDLVPINGHGNSNKSVLIPVSERESRIKKNIQSYVGSIAKGDPDIHKRIRLATKNRFGPIERLDYDGLREQWAWLQAQYPGGVVYDDAN